MLPDRVLNPGPLTYESGALPIALRSPATQCFTIFLIYSYLHGFHFPYWPGNIKTTATSFKKLPIQIA